MSESLRVMMVEDSDDDALLLQRALNKGGYTLTSKRVDNAVDMWKAITQEQWDVILVDYMIPGFGGIQALEIIESSGQDIPTILVSGKLSEESLVQAMKAGAHDCILKDALSRLAPAVKREIEEAKVRTERNIAVERMRHLNLALRAIRNVNQLIVAVKDRAKLLEGVCHCLTEDRGYDSAWVRLLDEDAKPTLTYAAGLDDTFQDVVRHQAESDDLLACISEVLRTKKIASYRDTAESCSHCPVRFAYPGNGALSIGIEHGDDFYGVLSVSLAPERVSDPEEISLFTEVAHDLGLALHTIALTEAREEAEARLKNERDFAQSLLDTTQAIVLVIDDKGLINHCNKYFEQLSGFECSEIVGKRFVELFIPDDYHVQLKPAFITNISNDDNVTAIIPIKCKDGSIKQIEWHNRNIKLNGMHKPNVLATGLDVTDRLAAVRQLQASEERYREVFDNNPIGIYRTTPDGRIILANKTMRQLMGCHHDDDISQLNVTESSSFRGYPREKLCAALEASDKVEGLVTKWVRDDGQTSFVRESARVIRDELGRIAYYEGTAEDVSERVKAEHELQASEERLRSVFEGAHDMIAILDEDAIVSWANPAFHDFLEGNNLNCETPFSTVHSADRKRLMSAWNSLVNINQPISEFEYRQVTTDNNEFHLYANAFPLKIENTNRYCVMMRDITETKRAQNELAASEAKLRELGRIINRSPAIAFRWLASEDWQVEYVSDNIEQFGYTRDELLQGNPRYPDIIHPDDVERVAHEVMEYSGDPDCHAFSQRYRIVAKDGTARWTDDRTWIQRDEAGNITHYQGIVLDIDDQVQAEMALRDSENRFRDLVETMPDGVVLLSPDLRIEYANTSFSKILRIDLEDLVSSDIEKYLNDANRTILQEQSQRLQVGVTGSFELDWDARYSSSPTTLISAVPRYDELGKYLGSFLVVTDITERKRAEEQVRQEMERAQQYLDIAGVMFVGLDLDGIVKLVNPKACEVLGYEKDELLGVNWFDQCIDEENRRKIRGIQEEIVSGPEEVHQQVVSPVVTRSNESRDIEWVNSKLRDEHGRTIGTLSSGKDITEILRSEEARRLAEQRYRQLFEGSLDGIVTTDMDGRFIDCNHAFESISGYSIQELRGMTYQQITPPEWRSAEDQIVLGKIVGEGYSGVYEKEYIRKDGTNIAVELSSYLISDDAGNPTGMWGICRDISTRKQFQAELISALAESKQREAEISALLAGAQAVLEQETFEQCAREIFIACKEVIKADGGYIALTDEAETENTPVHLDPGERDCDVDPALPMPMRGMREEALRKGKVVLDNNYSQSEHVKLLPGGHITIDNALFAPLIVKGQVRGLLGLANKEGGFNDRDLAMSSAFAELAAIALFNMQTLEALRNSQKQLQLALEGTAQGLWDWDMRGTHVYFSDRWCQMLGYEQRELTPDFATWRDLIHPDDLARTLQAVDKYLGSISTSEQDQYEVEVRLRCKDGSYKWIQARGKVVSFSDNGQPLRFTGTHTDITERKAAEEQLKQSHEALHEAHEQLKLHQRQLVQSEKLASLGQLAAGVAHEINNPIAYVKSNLGSLQDYIQVLRSLLAINQQLAVCAEAGDEAGIAAARGQLTELESREDVEFMLGDIDELITESLGGADRVRDIVRDLRNFAHTGTEETTETNINEIIESSLRIAWNELKYKCKVKKNLQPVPTFMGYPERLNQVIVNMLVNAAQAIDENGEVRISTELSADRIVVRISDTGSGISPEDITKLFDPFFTTKEVGVGTGLGLSISHAVIENHGGTIDVDSILGEGTTFTISLPLKGVNHD